MAIPLFLSILVSLDVPRPRFQLIQDTIEFKRHNSNNSRRFLEYLSPSTTVLTRTQAPTIKRALLHSPDRKYYRNWPVHWNTDNPAKPRFHAIM